MRICHNNFCTTFVLRSSKLFSRGRRVRPDVGNGGRATPPSIARPTEHPPRPSLTLPLGPVNTWSLNVDRTLPWTSTSEHPPRPSLTLPSAVPRPPPRRALRMAPAVNTRSNQKTTHHDPPLPNGGRRSGPARAARLTQTTRLRTRRVRRSSCWFRRYAVAGGKCAVRCAT